MVIDVHSHAWEYPEHFTDDFRRQARRAQAGVEVDLTVRYEDYRRSAAPGRARRSSSAARRGSAALWVDDRYVADYVAAASRHADRLSLGRSDAGRLAARAATTATRSSGCAASSCCRCTPASGPTTSGSTRSGSTPPDNGLPVLLHTGTTFVAQAPLECTLPRHLDPVATRFPEVKIILAHLGHPYEGECVVVDPQAPERLRRHQRPALPAVPALPQPDARAGIRRVGQGAVRHRLPVHHRATHRSTACASSTTCSKAPRCRGSTRSRSRR